MDRNGHKRPRGNHPRGCRGQVCRVRRDKNLYLNLDRKTSYVKVRFSFSILPHALTIRVLARSSIPGVRTCGVLNHGGGAGRD